MNKRVHDEVQRGAKVNALGVVGKMAGPALLVVITRLYGPDVFGIFITASAIIDMTLAFLTAGFKDAALMYVSRHADKADRRPLYQSLANAFGWSLLLGVTLALALFLLSPTVMPYLFQYGDRLSTMVQWMAVALPLMAFDRIVLAATQGLKLMKYEALVNGGLRPVLLLVSAVALYLAMPGILGLAIAYAVTQTTVWLISLVIYHREFQWKPLWRAARSFRVNRELISFAIPQNLNLALDRFLTNIDVLMLGYFGVSARLVGFYGAGAMIVRELRQIKLIFSSALAPQIVRLHRQKQVQQLSDVLATTSRWIATITIPALFAVAILRGDLLYLVSPEYSGRETLFMLLLLPIPYLQCSFGLAGNTVVMTGNSRLNLTNNFATGLVNILLNVWLIPPFGLAGAALASALAMLLKTALEIIEVRYMIGVPLLVHKLYKPHVAGLLAGTVLIAASVIFTPSLSAGFGYRLLTLFGIGTMFFAFLILLQGRLHRLHGAVASK